MQKSAKITTLLLLTGLAFTAFGVKVQGNGNYGNAAPACNTLNPPNCRRQINNNIEDVACGTAGGFASTGSGGKFQSLGFCGECVFSDKSKKDCGADKYFQESTE